MLYFAAKFINLEIVIRKGGGIRPFEALATLYFFREGAKFYLFWADN